LASGLALLVRDRQSPEDFAQRVPNGSAQRTSGSSAQLFPNGSAQPSGQQRSRQGSAARGRNICDFCNFQHGTEFVCRSCDYFGCTGRIQGRTNPICGLCREMKGMCRLCTPLHFVDKQKGVCRRCEICAEGVVFQGYYCPSCGHVPPSSEAAAPAKRRRREDLANESENDSDASDRFEDGAAAAARSVITFPFV